MFTKFLTEMDADTLGKTMKDLGLDGVDLAVREDGNIDINKQSVSKELPKFKETLKKHGINISMITTNIVDAGPALARETIETAGKLGIKYMKLGYWDWKGFGTYHETAAVIKKALKGLEPILLDNGVKAGVHPHSVWSAAPNANHLLRYLEGINEKAVGVYFDVGHAFIEGSGNGWAHDFELAQDRIFMLAVKNLAWYKMEGEGNGKNGWVFRLVPLDSGLADIPAFLKCLKKTKFDGPVSFHSEYKEWCSWKVLNTKEMLEQTKVDLAYWKKSMKA